MLGAWTRSHTFQFPDLGGYVCSVHKHAGHVFVTYAVACREKNIKLVLCISQVEGLKVCYTILYVGGVVQKRLFASVHVHLI